MDSRIKRVTLKCQHCGKAFVVQEYRVETAKYCSTHCRAVSNTGANHEKRRRGVDKTCENCGEVYYVLPCRAARSKFCSRSCASSFINSGNRTHLWKGGKVTKKCARCGSEFSVNPNDKRRVYCSTACHDLARIVRVERTCLYCGKKYIARPRMRFAHTFCSRDCSRKYHPTTIEVMIRDVVAKLGVEYVPEQRIGRFYIDVYIPSARVAIECDGDYWHSTERVIARDAIKDAYLAEHGITVVRLAEHDIRTRIEHCAQLIASHL